MSASRYCPLESKLAQSCCWDSDLNLCYCQMDSTSSSCYDEVGKVPDYLGGFLLFLFVKNCNLVISKDN